MKKSYELVMKDIANATTESVDSLRMAVLEQLSFLHPILDKVQMDSGVLLYPYTKLPSTGDTEYGIEGLTLTRSTEATVRPIIKETIEDANPSVGIEKALETLMAQQTALEIENSVVTTLLADAAITSPATTVDWAGIVASIVDMGSHAFATKGSFLVVLSLEDYMGVISDAAYDRAQDDIKNKVKLVVSAEIPAGSMLVIHEYGIAGSFQVSGLEEDGSPASEKVDLVLPYKLGLGYDTDFLRKVVI